MVTRPAEAIRFPFPHPDKYELSPKTAALQADGTPCRVRLPYGEEAWLVTRYDDARSVLSDRRFGRDYAGRDVPRTTPYNFLEGSILAMDPPEHTRLRKLAAKAFTLRRVEALRDRTRVLAGELVDAMIAAGPPGSITSALAAPLPMTVICTLLGVPAEDRDRFRAWTEAMLSTDSADPAAGQAGAESLLGYFGELAARRRREPADDLVSAMLAARDAEDVLSEDEVVMLAMNLLLGGHETTTAQISNFCYLLLVEPDRWAALAADPGLVPRAVEELLRYVPVLAGGAMPAYATEDVEIGGVTVRAGEPVIVDLAAANRDGAEFTDPERLDLTRAHNPHLSFSHGAHHCMGVSLARMELQVALEALVTRLPGPRLAVPPEEIHMRQALTTSLVDLPVTW